MRTAELRRVSRNRCDVLRTDIDVADRSLGHEAAQYARLDGSIPVQNELDEPAQLLVEYLHASRQYLVLNYKAATSRSSFRRSGILTLMDQRRSTSRKRAYASGRIMPVLLFLQECAAYFSRL